MPPNEETMLPYDRLAKVLKPLAVSDKCPPGVDPCPFYKQLSGNFWGCTLCGGKDCYVMGKTKLPDTGNKAAPQPEKEQTTTPQPAKEPAPEEVNYKILLINLLAALRTGNMLLISVRIAEAAKAVNMTY